MVLELNNIEKSFGEKKVLHGISFRVQSGSAFGLLGRNGAGKTTTLRILMNVFPADCGEVLLDGKPIDYDKIGIGYLPEERGLYPKKPIIDQLLYFAQLHGMKKKDALASIHYWLGRLGMSKHEGDRLNTLSKGNQQKIQLITALAHDPDIIILDEPFSGLDPVNARLLKDVVKEQMAKGKILIFSSHQMSYIEEFCDSFAIIKDGEIAIGGNLASVKRSFPRDRLVVSCADTARILADGQIRTEPQGQHQVLVHLDHPSEKQDMMQRLVQNYDIDGITVYEPSLNDIFVTYAGDGEESEVKA